MNATVLSLEYSHTFSNINYLNKNIYLFDLISSKLTKYNKRNIITITITILNILILLCTLFYVLVKIFILFN